MVSGAAGARAAKFSYQGPIFNVCVTSDSRGEGTQVIYRLRSAISNPGDLSSEGYFKADCYVDGRWFHSNDCAEQLLALVKVIRDARSQDYLF